jgi:lipopolysaccharide transport system ATP-binding protein
MSDVVIKAEGLGKSYIIGHNAPRGKYITLREVVTKNIKGTLKKTGDLFKGNAMVAGEFMEEFWALKDVNFEVNRGDAVGVIGRNGAGKSTLLKVLSRITEPSVGRVTIKGRVASLLEVGTGFHQELSGRDNIFLNGAILGMSRAEIRSKFDEIVEFAGVEKFLDTPVKRYSSGMYVRLAFAVAAHLESEILIVDEVLAVGDAEFQKKCLGKIGEVSKGEGKTVFFVSHNIAAVKQLCNKGIFLENGSIKKIGEMVSVIDSYTERIENAKLFTPFKIKEIGLLVKSVTLNKNRDEAVIPFEPLYVDIEIEAERDVDKIGVQIMISNEDTIGNIFASNTKTTNNIDIKLKKGINTITCHIDKFNLSSGKYWLGLGIDLPFVLMYYFEQSLIKFEVAEVLVAPRLLSTAAVYGHVYLDHQWSIK